MLPPKNLKTKAELDAWYDGLTEDQKDSHIAFAIGGGPSPAPQKEYSTGNVRYPREEDCEDNEEAA